MGLLFIVMIMVIIILITKNKGLKDENDNLRVNTFNKINFCPKCGYSFRNCINNVNFCPCCGHNFINLTQQNIYESTKTIKEKHTDKEIKNSLILIIGSILVVLASIIFLTSTWNVIHNVVKIGVLIFMLAMFLSISYVSDKYLNLKQTSKAFYYIAFAYIPIILFSISMFKLFGEYLSLYGNGRYIYLTIGCILVALLYYFSSKKRTNKTIFVFSTIFQILGIIFLILNFVNDTSVIFIGLLMYSIFTSILNIKNKICFDKKFNLILCSSICISVSSLLILHNFINMIFNNINIFDVIASMLLFLNIYFLLIKVYNKDNIYKFIYPLLIILIFNNVGYLFDNIMFRQALILASFAVIYMYNIAKENKINIVTYIEILVSFAFFYIIWTLVGMFGVNLLDSYILFGVITFLSLINYIYDESTKGFSATMLIIGVVITLFSLVTKFDLTSTVIGYISFLLVLCSMFLKNIDISLKKALKWVGIISLMLITLINFNVTIWDLLLYSSLSIISIILGLRENNNLYKIISYVYTNVFLISIATYTNLDISNYVIPFTTIMFTLIERFIPMIKSKATDDYLIVSFIISLLILNGINNIYGFLFILILSLTFIYYVVYYKKDRSNFIIPLLGAIPYLYLSDILIINNFNIMYILSFAMLSLLWLLIYTRKNNLYITMFYVYSFFHITCLEEVKYLGISILLLGSIVCYLVKNNKVKDIYKVLIYLFGLILYNFIINDLGISNMTSINTGIYLIFTLLLTRTVLKKYGNGYKVWEYVLCVLINLSALGSYISEYDGLIYVIFLTLLVIISYILKYGPAFLVCLISILINIILLTQTLWLNLPWWLYILIIGGVLIGFAIYNEVKDKKNSDDPKETLKDKLDL